MKKKMKKTYSRILLITILLSSVFSVHISTYTAIPNSNIQIKNEPKAAASANLAAWIVIAGDRSDHDKLDLIRSGTDKAYEALINRGFTASEIYYLDPAYATVANPQSGYRDADTTLANIQGAIETWAPTQGVDATHGLGIYLFDHGGTGYMCLPGTDLTDANLNSYLDNLEASHGVTRFIIVYEACHAGSFINPVSKDNRIVVAATDITHNSHVNAAWDWAAFSETFWSSITQCKTIGEAFEDAEANVHALGYGAVQIPWIDDNHDEDGSPVDGVGNLPNGGDGTDALDVWIGTGSNCPNILVFRWPLRFWIERIPPFPPPVWVIINTDAVVKDVYARVIPPDWIPPTPEPEDPKLPDGIALVGDEGVLRVQLYDPDGDGNYTGNLYSRNNPDFWGDDGDYQVNIIARTQENAIAKIVSPVITVNEDGNPPPDTTNPTIAIITPSDDALVSGIVGVIAEGDDDQGLDKMQIFVDDVEVEEELMPSYLPYPEVTYSLNTADYSEGNHTIRATATDNSGNTASASIEVIIGGEDGIPGYYITILIFGSIIGVVMIYFISKKKIKTLS